MGDDKTVEEFPDQDQRFAVCQTAWSGTKEDNVSDTTKQEKEYSCECIACGRVVKTVEHCKDIKCPDCGGEMRREGRPGTGQFEKPPEKQTKEFQLENEMFPLNVVSEMLSGPITTEIPSVYLVGEIVDNGAAEQLEIIISGLRDSEVLEHVKHAILMMFPETYRDRILIDTWSGIGDTPPSWSSYKSVAQIGILPYNGSTVIRTREEFAEVQKKENLYSLPALPQERNGHAIKRLDGVQIKVKQFQRSGDAVYFSGVAMTPGTFNGDTFTADVLSKSTPFWKDIPLVLNHEDEESPYTIKLGKVIKAWWDEDTQQLWVQGIVTEPDMVSIMDKGHMPTMSPKLDLYILIDTEEIVEIFPVHLALLIVHPPANPEAGAVGAVTV